MTPASTPELDALAVSLLRLGVEIVEGSRGLLAVVRGEQVVIAAEGDARAVRANAVPVNAADNAGALMLDAIATRSAVVRGEAVCVPFAHGAFYFEGVRTHAPQLDLLASTAGVALGAVLRKMELDDENAKLEQARGLLEGETRLLEMVAKGERVGVVLDAVCRLVEELCPGPAASIMLVTPDGGHLVHAAAPTLPPSYSAHLDGAAIGPDMPSCGTAAFRGEEVVVTDIANDPLWQNYRDVALSHGLRACWSSPIRALSGRVLGTMALSYREPLAPNEHERAVIEQLTHLASIVLERDRAERALRRSDAYLAEAQRLSATGSFVWEPDTGALIWSDESFRIFGLDPSIPPTLERAADRVHPDDRPKFYAEVQRGVEQRSDWDFEERLLMPDGTLKYLHIVARGSTGESGQFEVVGALQDVTAARLADEELRRAKEQLQDSERHVRMIVDTIPALAWSGRPDGWIEFLNLPWLHYTGLTMDEATGWGWQAAIHPEDEARLMEIWGGLIATGTAGELEARLRRHDGVYRWFLFRGQPLFDAHGRVLKWYGTNTDIDDLKRAEAALRRNEEHLNLAQKLSRTGSYSWNVATGEVHWSDEIYRIFEFPPGTTPSLPPVIERTHPDDVAGFQAILDRAARDGRGWEHERRLRMPDGTEKIVFVVTHAIRDAAGALEFTGAVRDVTAVRREEARLQASLEEKDALLREVHHRVKNNLQLISSLLNLQAARTTDRDVAELFTDSRNRVRSMALVHENLYRAGNFARVQMAAHLENLCAQLRRAYLAPGQDIELLVNVQPIDLELDLDRAVSCGLVINELVSNSLKHAFPEGRGGRVRIGLECLDGVRHVLTVRDDGIGISADAGLGRDDSLGMQLVNDLTAQLHGEIATRHEGGTEFVITFVTRT